MSGALMKFWTYLYYDVFEENEFLFFAGASLIVSFVVFWGLSGLFLYVDVTGKPQWMRKYKVQPGTNDPLDPERARAAVKVAVINQMLISAPLLLMIYPLQRYMGCSCRPEDLPSVWKFLRDVIGIALCEEFGFYYLHRLNHWGPLYRNIHKKHHEWTAPTAITCVYAHPLEHIFVNLMPLLSGPILMGSHLFVILIWYSFALYSTIMTHSDYHLPFMQPPEWHDYHHSKFNNNFGTGLLLDWLHGTNKAYNNSVEKKRRKILFSLTPMRELIPDEYVK